MSQQPYSPNIVNLNSSVGNGPCVLFDEQNAVDRMWITEKTKARWFYYYGDSAYVFQAKNCRITLTRYQMSNRFRYRSPGDVYIPNFHDGCNYQLNSQLEADVLYSRMWSSDFPTLCANLGVTPDPGEEKNFHKHHPLIGRGRFTTVYRMYEGKYLEMVYHRDTSLYIGHYVSPRTMTDSHRRWMIPCIYQRVTNNDSQKGSLQWKSDTETLLTLFSREQFDEITMLGML